MFDPAALSLTSALNPAAIPANAVMLENAGSTGGPAETAQTGGFEALLALQTAPAAMPVAPDPAVARPAPQVPAPATAKPATGKTLPVAAMPLAAFDTQLAGTLDDVADATTEQDPTGQHHPADADIPAFADSALIAAIFAAPDRLPPAPAEAPRPHQPASPVNAAVAAPVPALPEQQPDMRPKAAQPQATQQTAGAQPTIAAAALIAQTAAMELETDADPFVPDQSAKVAVAATPIPMPERRAAVSQTMIAYPETGENPATPEQSAKLATPAAILPAATATSFVVADRPERPGAVARAETQTPAPETDLPLVTKSAAAFIDEIDEALQPGTVQDAESPLVMHAAEARPAQEAAPSARTEPRVERIDFATLVETLNRAREEASPNTVRVSLSHTDFGRVSLRFDQDDKGLSVAMSSADPGFARAVAASNDAASTTTTPDSQRGQSSQTNTGGNAQGEGNRQPQGQRTATPDRPAAQLRDTLRREDGQASASGIFA